MKKFILIIAGLLIGPLLGEAMAVPTFQAAGTAVNSSASVSPVWPAHAVNDIALLFVETPGGRAATLTTAAGFVAVLNSPQFTGGGVTGTRITVFWARATSTTMAAPTVETAGDHVFAQIITYRSVISTGDPWDVTGGGVKATASTSVTVASVTTTVADTLIVQAVARDNDLAAAAFSAQTNVNLTGIVERSDTGSTLGKGGGFGVWDGVKATAGATGNTTATVTSSVNAFLTIALKPLPPPTVAKSFSPATIGTGGVSTLTVTLTNANATAITGVAFTDTYPGNLVNAATPALTNTCLGTATAAANGSSLALSGGRILANSSCTVTVAVASAVAGSYLNSTGPVTTTNAGTGTAATATLTVLTPPTVAKSFSPATIGTGGTSTLTVTLTNSNATAITGAAFTDTYPANVTNTGTPGLTNTCGGTPTAAVNGSSLALSGGTIPASGSCTLTVKVTSAVAGSYLNSTGSVTTTNAGSGAAATAILTVTAPTVAKSFSPATIALNGTSTLTITLTNATATAFTGAAFTDVYPADLLNTATPGAATTCALGTVSAANNGTSLALSGGTIPANGSCTVTVAVTSAVQGSYLNSTGPVTTTNQGTGTAATAILAVNSPTVAKSFSPATIVTGGTSTLTITLTNANAIAFTGAAFTDVYPANLLNTATPGAATTCTGGTVTAADNGTSLALSGGTIPANGSCTVTVAVTSAVAGSYLNNTGSVTTANSGAGTAATATLTVLAVPTVAKSFSPATIGTGGSSTLTVTLSNSNATAITGAAFTDTYPSNLLNAATPALTNTCVGTATAAANGSSLALSGGTIPASGSCTLTVKVTSTVAGSYLNSTGSVTTTNAGSGTAATATLTVLMRPTVAKSFSPASIGTGGSSTLTVTLTNANATAITGAAFTDVYPANLFNTATPGAATTCTGGTVTAAANDVLLALSGGTIPANGSCTVTVAVTSAVVGSYLNSTGPVTTTNAGSGAAATAILTVTVPTVAKSFSPATIALNGTSTLTITLTNSHAIAFTGAAFTDVYPADLLNAATPNAKTTCAGGTVTAAASGTSLALSGGTIPANGSCTVTVAVTSAVQGSYLNSTGPVTTTNGGTGTAATATLAVNSPTVAKSFSPATIALMNGTSTLTITLSNATATAFTGAAFTDAYPLNLLNAATPALTNSCGGTATAAASGTSLALSGGTIPANGSCTVTVAVTSAVAGSYLNNTGEVTTTNSGAGTEATATLTVEVIHVSVSKTAIQAEVLPLSEITYTAIFQNTSSLAANMTSVTDTLPDGFTYKAGSATGLTTVNPTVTGRNLIWSGTWTIPAGGSQTLGFKAFAANQRGTYTNQVSASGTNFDPSASGNVAPVKVVAPAISLTKIKDKDNAPPGGIITYGLNYLNQGDAPASTVIFLDKIPENTTYVPTSASGTGVDIQYSHDGGSGWDNIDTAPVTDIKWTLTAPLQPDGGGSLSFKVVVK
jgi:uncharacterized repeat protein (TIGR01451 family)